MGLNIKPVNGENAGDFLKFFDGMIFEDHPDWKKCYCYSYHFTGSAEEWNIPGRNRECAETLIKQEHMKGYLAYNGTVPVGWVNANDRNNYERLKALWDIWDIPSGKICSVVCFVIRPDFRNQGIATTLLKRVCKDYGKMNYDYIEAYPETGEKKFSDHFMGPQSMYQRQGFETVKKIDGHNVMRKKL